MTPPVCVEIVKVVVNSAYTTDKNISKPGLEAVSKAPGCLSTYLGNEEQDSQNVFLIHVWESLKLHQDFIADADKYAPVQEGLTLVMKSLTYLIHVYLASEPHKALTSPLTEFAIFTLKKSAKNDRMKCVAALIELVNAMNLVPESLGGIGGAAWGPVVENDRQYVVVCGWRDLESWQNVPNLPGARHLLDELHRYADVDVKHARLSEFKVSTPVVRLKTADKD